MFNYSSRTSIKSFIVFCAIVSFVSCDNNQNKGNMNSEENTNILLEEWTGPYGGVPAFDKMKIADIKPAFEKAMALNLTEIDEITSNSEVPTFENTIVSLEKAGEELSRIQKYYGIWSANMSSPEFRKI